MSPIICAMLVCAAPAPHFAPRPAFVPRPVFAAEKNPPETSGLPTKANEGLGAIKGGGESDAQADRKPAQATAATLPASPRARAILWTDTSTPGWCGPCRLLRPGVARLRQRGLPIEEHDPAAEPQTYAAWRIAAIPTLQVIAPDGREIVREAATSVDQIERTLRRHGLGASP